MEKIKVALIGAGYIANYHARGLQAIPGVEIAAVVAVPLPAAQDFAARYGIAEAYNSIDPVLSRADIHAVVYRYPE